MVLTSLSLHVIGLLLWLISEQPMPGAGHGHDAEPPGTMIILSKEISPDRPSHPAPPPSPPPEKTVVVDKTVKPAPRQESASTVSAEAILSGRGGDHLNGGVVFLLDISGSMYESYGGATRLALARKFVDRQIAALPNGTPFAIALYGETTKQSGPLVAASNATRAAAMQYLSQDYDCGGGTNLPAGFEVAENLRPATIILVSDGDLNIESNKLMKETRRILGQPGPQLSVYAIAPRHNTDDEALLENLVREQAGSYQAMDVPGAH